MISNRRNYCPSKASTSQESHRQEPRTISNVFGLYVDKILGELNTTFSVMHHKIFRGSWNNSMTAKLRRNQVTTDWQQGEYEFYMPTRAEEERDCLQFYRIIVKVLPKLDRQTIDKSLLEMQKPRLSPVGSIDSELIVFVAPYRSETARQERQSWRYGGKLRGFRHVKKNGYLTAIIINPSPLICLKRLYTIIIKFLKSRIAGLLKKLDFQPWQYDYRKKEYLYYSVLIRIIEGFSYLIAQSLKVLSHSLNWLLKRYRQTLRAIGRENMVQEAMHKLRDLKNIFRFLGVKEESKLALIEQALTTSATGMVTVHAHCPWKFQPKPQQNKASPQERGDPQTFVDRLAHAKPLNHPPDKARISWGVSNG